MFCRPVDRGYARTLSRSSAPPPPKATPPATSDRVVCKAGRQAAGRTLCTSAPAPPTQIAGCAYPQKPELVFLRNPEHAPFPAKQRAQVKREADDQERSFARCRVGCGEREVRTAPVTPRTLGRFNFCAPPKVAGIRMSTLSTLVAKSLEIRSWCVTRGRRPK